MEGAPPARHGHAAKRTGIATLVGLSGAAVAAVAGAPWGVAVTAGWCAAAVLFLGWVWLAIWRMGAAETAAHAQREDSSRAAAELVLLSASVASLIAVGYTLVEAGHRSATVEGLMIGLAILSVALAWASVHTIFTLRYGDLYYSDPAGGIEFNDDEPPDYRDFAYLGFTIGMTYQVSDTNLKSREIRRTVLRHAIISFVFGTVILAVTINLVASLLNR